MEGGPEAMKLCAPMGGGGGAGKLHVLVGG